MFKGVKKMVVVDNLLYVLDTEVSFMIPPVDTVSNTTEWLLHKFIWQDTLSLWDLHFLVVIHCWPDLTIHDFELITECGSASMVSWVSLSYISAVHNILNDVYQNKLNLCHSQDKGNMKIILLTKQDTSQVSVWKIR